MLAELTFVFFNVLVGYIIGCYFTERRVRRRAEKLDRQRRMFALDPGEYADFDLE